MAQFEGCTVHISCAVRVCFSSVDHYHCGLFNHTVEDWDMFEKLLDYIYAKDIKSESGLHPVLMSEASVSDRDNTIQVMYKQQCQYNNGKLIMKGDNLCGFCVVFYNNFRVNTHFFVS